MAVLNLKGKGGSMFLEPGNHLVHIWEIKDNDRTPQPSIDIYFRNDKSQTVKEMFSLSEKAQWRIALLAIASGAVSGPEDPQLENFDTSDLIGKDVMIQVVKEDKYSTVKSFWKVDAGAKSLIDGLKRDQKKKASPATSNEPEDGEDEGPDPF